MKSTTGIRLAAAGSAAVLTMAAGASGATALPGTPSGAPDGSTAVALDMTSGQLELTPAPRRGAGTGAGTGVTAASGADPGGIEQATVPDDPAYAFLGRPGDPLWLGGDGPEAGWDTTGVSADQVAPGGLQWSLTAAQGPGPVIAYTPAAATPGAPEPAGPQVVFDSGDGLPDTGTLPVAASGPLVWAFPRPGDYRLTLTASALLPGGGTSTATLHRTVRVTGTASTTSSPSSPSSPVSGPASPPATATAPQPVLPVRLLAARTQDAPSTQAVTIGDGHVDALAGRIVDGRLRLVFKDSRTPDAIVWREPSSVVVHVNDKAVEHVPAGGAYSFLGTPGSAFWLIPQVQKPGVVWAGWNTEALRAADLEGPVGLQLSAVSGPGAVTVWETAGLGGAQVIYNSRDGLPDTQRVDLGVHAHANWGFSAAGTYKLTFRLQGTLRSGGTATDTRTYTFTVGDRPGTGAPTTPPPASPTAPAGSTPSGAGGPASPGHGPASGGSGSAGPGGGPAQGSLARTGAGGTVAGAVAAAALTATGAVAVFATRRRRRTGTSDA